MNEFMKTAIDLSSDNLESNNGGPFGACVVKNGIVIGKGSNRVVIDNDPTAHAEIVAIRNACKNENTHDLSGCELYTSCYPCPMCLSAIIWSNIRVVYYANTKEDADTIGFRDNDIYEYLKGNNKNMISLKQMNREEAIKVFERYQKDKDKVTY